MFFYQYVGIAVAAPGYRLCTFVTGQRFGEFGFNFAVTDLAVDSGLRVGTSAKMDSSMPTVA